MVIGSNKKNIVSQKYVWNQFLSGRVCTKHPNRCFDPFQTLNSAIFLSIVYLCSEWVGEFSCVKCKSNGTIKQVNIPSFVMFLIQLHWRHLKLPHGFFSLAFILGNVWPPISVVKLQRQYKQKTIKHTTENMVTQPSDRFVCRTYMS